MKFSGALIYFPFAFLPATAYADISGVYIAADEHNAEIIHLVEDKSGALAGQFEIIKIEGTAVKTSSHPLTGTVRNRAIAISLKAPLAEWLGAGVTFTGEIGRDTLTLSYGGGASTYIRTTTADREDVLRRIRQEAARLEYAEFAARATNNLVMLERAVKELARRAPDDIAWFGEQKAAYSTLHDSQEALSQRIDSAYARRADPSTIFPLQDRFHDLSDDVIDLDQAVIDRSSSIRSLKVEIESAAKALRGPCPDGGDATEFCERVSTLLKEFDNSLTSVRHAYDELAAFRNSLTL